MPGRVDSISAKNDPTTQYIERATINRTLATTAIVSTPPFKKPVETAALYIITAIKAGISCKTIMKIIISTPIKNNYRDVFAQFNIELFKALKPPMIGLVVERFDGCKKGDEVHALEEYHCRDTPQ